MESKKKKEDRSWIGFDLDGTLALAHKWLGHQHIGPPIPNIVRELRVWREMGRNVKIFTARVARHNASLYNMDEAIAAIEAWSLEHLGEVLPITAEKDFDLELFYDDRAVALVSNTGLGLTDLFQKQVGDWSLEHFSHADDGVRTRKLQEELNELVEKPDDAMEMADIFLVLLHHASAHNVDLFQAAMRKFEICQQRQWLPPDEHGIRRHVKSE